ncbi:hypothetical protein BDN72DRAFT_779332 [Pluteus cervinus]|uniref:Uncharacterized protein n=1 Tax=Pluteus cervinus TaxID=181527 RepID=A0ACD3A498_9AGAR|nr:hypothetical protein BDN72DRAFT_779332 [Pluteus cervinus]
MQGWPGYKWVLFLSVVIVSLLGITGLLYAFLTWFRAWKHAGVMAIVDSELLLLITFSSAFFLLTALPGFTGTLFDSQQLLTMYTLFQILCLVLITAVFYLSHKRATSTLPEALQLSWTQVFTPIDRLAIQHSLHCCGYQSAFQSATRSEDCHAGTSLPGCKQAFVDFESRNLGKIWRGAVVCGLIFLVDMFVGYLCAQRLTGVFALGGMGKGSRGDGQTRRILEKLKSFRLGRGRSSGASADSEDIILNIRKPEPFQPRARADTRAVSSGVRHEGHGHNGREASLNGRNGNGGGYDRDYFSNAHQGQGYAF